MKEVINLSTPEYYLKYVQERTSDFISKIIGDKIPSEKKEAFYGR